MMTTKHLISILKIVQFYGWRFIVIEHNNTVFKILQEILNNRNIIASVIKCNLTEITNNTLNPNAIIINLLDKETLKKLNNSNKIILSLQELAQKGIYILFITEDLNITQRLANQFNPPLDYPSTSKIKITKLYKNGSTEIITHDLMIVVGRTYKNLNGKLIPIDITGTVHIEGSNNLYKAVHQALDKSLISIINIEINSSLRR